MKIATRGSRALPSLTSEVACGAAQRADRRDQRTRLLGRHAESEKTSLFNVIVASLTVERPRSVICTRVVRPSLGCGTRSTSPAASSSRIACVTLVTCTCSRSDAFPIGNAPVRLNASRRSSSNREKLRS